MLVSDHSLGEWLACAVELKSREPPASPSPSKTPPPASPSPSRPLPPAELYSVGLSDTIKKCTYREREALNLVYTLLTLKEDTLALSMCKLP